MSLSAPATYKQPSRKGKKAWRKNVDVTEVDEGLHQLREEIITGGVISEKTNEQLFTLDVVGDKSIVKKLDKKHKVLKCDEILNTRSPVPAVSSKKRGPESALTDGVIPEKKHKKNWVTNKDLLRLRKIAEGGTEVAVAKSGSSLLHDPWAEPEPPAADKFTFLEKAQPIKAPATLKHAPISLAASGKAIPAVQLPDGGISYNPQYELWEELVHREGAAAVEAEKKRLKEEQEEREMLERRRQVEEEERLALEKGSVEEDNDSEEDNDEQAGEETKESFVKKRAERKTRVQRNKEKRRKEEERKRQQELQQKKLRQQLEMLKQIKLAVEAKDSAELEEQAQKAEDDGDMEKAIKLRRRRLGKNVLPQRPLELQLADELADSLRRLKPEGNLLKERFRSLMERGIVETRNMPVTAKKRKYTESEKWSYKDFK